MLTNNQLNKLFLLIAEELDIPDYLFEKAEKSYLALGEYINNHCDCNVSIYTQGSFRLGTVIRPLSEEDEYDLDLVTVVDASLQPKPLKFIIGDILRDSSRYSSMLEEKKRCWRIEYADEAQFHMDITPAMSADSNGSILVTNKGDNGEYTFTMSNPVGYSAWFETRKQVFKDISTNTVIKSSSVEPVKTKTNQIKLPLQRAIQILKRHRDKTFKENPEVKPISVIITTLSAQAYCGEAGVYDALTKILDNMLSYIELRDGKYYIPNPSNFKENFADKWNKEPEKARSFFHWQEKAKKDIISAATGIVDDYSALEESLGESVVQRAVSETNPIKHDSDLPTSVYNTPVIKSALSVSHRQKPPFKLPKFSLLGIKATVTDSVSSYSYPNNGEAIPKNCSIDFVLIVSPSLIRGNYIVKWQVVNTGEEARLARGLRGGFDTEVNSVRHHESTFYTGTHYVQAFLIKSGRCIAMSREFVVNIK